MSAPEPASAPAPVDPRTPEPWEVAESPRRPRNNGELALSTLLLLLGIYLVIGAGSITIPGSSNTVGPRFFPYLVGAATIAIGGVLAIRVLRGDQGPEEAGEDVDPDAKTSWRAVGIISLAFLAHALLINVIGWPLSVTLMFGVVAWSLGSRGVVRPLIAGGIVSVVVWLVFVKALGVVLPGGILLELATGWIG
ncbi:tripartite tricarboxylate transporter TctB family protein [Microlunatus antarcticus]|uniref:Putative tricarboxylic transport membrane protein n=1 Tax=Microlunatus antarcticus TaxID=53388 RepID=A0A7W5P9C2_9ACTN|nr:putative tricarboxylic transport membrane protein [Microlunatus antarcticus]